jgi:hypothetical protein
LGCGNASAPAKELLTRQDQRHLRNAEQFLPVGRYTAMQGPNNALELTGKSVRFFRQLTAGVRLQTKSPDKMHKANTLFTSSVSCEVLRRSEGFIL